MNEILNIKGIECYEQDGVVYLKLETVARGLGFTRVATSGNEVVRWERVRKYLTELGIATSCDDSKSVPTSGHDPNSIDTCVDGTKLPDFIPENIFYRLAMKAKNEVAEQFQAKIADEVIPSIRKHGTYMTPETLEEVLLNPDTIIKIATALKEEQDKNKALQVKNSSLTVENTIMQPKAEYFDELVDRNLLTGIRETAKEFQIKERDFVSFLINKKYMYRDKKGKLMPYAQHIQDGLFEIKERMNETTNWSGTQTFITPKGRETFRLLYLKTA